MDLVTILSNGVVAALVGALSGAAVSFGLQGRADARKARRMHRAAVSAVREELSATDHVIRLMVSNESVMTLPASDIAYRAMSRELLAELPDDLTSTVVRGLRSHGAPGGCSLRGRGQVSPGCDADVARRCPAQGGRAPHRAARGGSRRRCCGPHRLRSLEVGALRRRQG